MTQLTERSQLNNNQGDTSSVTPNGEGLEKKDDCYANPYVCFCVELKVRGKSMGA